MTTTDPNRTRPRRLTVDLDPEMHRDLHLWWVGTGIPGASSAGTLRALTARLLTDPELAAAVTADLAADLARK
ncbi:hypothetical protein ACFV9C_44300 [Kribbella sp. NPDC059898]|uniref:hypothetical protein n=1 Tax=Kribbella sp. NPDC059898 TaxID=3346995 RepID=UPI0036663D34